MPGKLLLSFLALWAVLFPSTARTQVPPAEMFLVRRSPVAPGPQITPYLQYQLDQAWQQDEPRRREFASVTTEEEMRKVQERLRDRLRAMIGGLPTEKTDLHAQITGTIRRPGYRIEKVIFESLPGFHVTALLYLPESASGRLPAILVPCGHSQNGKIHYQYICSRLARLGYAALTWDPVGQGERSQFWDAARRRSRYNLGCGEHAVLGNIAYLADASLARWEIWDGIRAFDYLLTRPEVDGSRISVTGTSGGGTQTAYLGALEPRLRVVAPSCYITSLPMRMANRIFKDPSSDPEQDLFGMVSERLDHAGLLLLAYPRPVFVAAAVEDFFPVEGTRSALREVSSLYRRLGHPDRVGRAEGYHGHQYSPANLLAAIQFISRFSDMPAVEILPPEDKLPDQELLCTRSGQVRVDFPEGKPLIDLIAEYFAAQKGRAPVPVRDLYRGRGYPGLDRMDVVPMHGSPSRDNISWQFMGEDTWEGLRLQRFLLHHSGNLSLPLLLIREADRESAEARLWFSDRGKAGPEDWNAIRTIVTGGVQLLTFDFRGQGEDRMQHRTAASDEWPAPEGYDPAFYNPVSGVMANYVYNSLLSGRPYFLQMIEDVEVVVRFAREKLKIRQLQIDGTGAARLMAESAAGSIPGLQLYARPEARSMRWSAVVEQKMEIWPIQYLLPGGAYIR